MCDICSGEPFCPVCGKDAPKQIECEMCQGYGTIYFDYKGEQLDFEEWQNLFIEQQCSEKCTKCNGSGYVEEKY